MNHAAKQGLNIPQPQASGADNIPLVANNLTQLLMQLLTLVLPAFALFRA